MKFFKRFRKLSWSKLRQGARELDGARGFLRAMRSDWGMWVCVIGAIVSQTFWVLAVIAVCAMVGVTCKEWTLSGYSKMLDGYGTMVDQQQGIIGAYQGEHPSHKAARNRLGRMN